MTIRQSSITKIKYQERRVPTGHSPSNNSFWGTNQDMINHHQKHQDEQLHGEKMTSEERTHAHQKLKKKLVCPHN